MTMQCHISVKSSKGGKKQVSSDGFLVKVAQKEKKSTDSSDSISDNESRPTQ
jgi:hypothetical protein